MNKSIKSLFLLSGLAAGAANAATPGERLLGAWTGSEKGYENNIYTDNVVEYAIVQAKGNSAIGYKLEKKKGAANWEKVSSVSATVTSSSAVSTFEQGPASEGRLINNRLELRLDDPAINGELLVIARRDKNLHSIEVSWPVIPEPLNKYATAEEVVIYTMQLDDVLNKLESIRNEVGKSPQAKNADSIISLVKELLEKSRRKFN